LLDYTLSMLFLQHHQKEFVMNPSNSVPVEVILPVFGTRLHDGWYGGKRINCEEDIWNSFWNLVTAAGKIAEGEWLLNDAGATGGNCWDTRPDPPRAGFHLRLTNKAYNGGEEKNQHYEYWSGKGFPATQEGLEKALFEAEKARQEENVIEVLLEISWRGCFPGDFESYCGPILHWKIEN